MPREREHGLQKKTERNFGYSEHEQSCHGGALTHTHDHLVWEVGLDMN